ncbi:Uncharacterised protein [Achromobacter insolitus]|nr:Uncharacterised protein [Achromobacter insolitus]
MAQGSLGGLKNPDIRKLEALPLRTSVLQGWGS